ncbi:hypothetical protein EYF80_009370 [Liparis tanakae]|uniref:Uncharacterized protein n=1 Tax=Liparis tanakae TaxID=230148 RepID=A0A4Z2IR73_9TELE|nr:hypothetical protein EYF80_009370 [Liparis tanakae]
MLLHHVGEDDMPVATGPGQLGAVCRPGQAEHTACVGLLQRIGPLGGGGEMGEREQHGRNCGGEKGKEQEREPRVERERGEPSWTGGERVKCAGLILLSQQQYVKSRRVLKEPTANTSPSGAQDRDVTG